MAARVLRRFRPALLAMLVLLLAAPGRAQEASRPESGPEPEPRSESPTRFPQGATVQFRSLVQEGTDVVLEGDVVLDLGDVLLQADRMVYREERTVEAEGNVLVVWAGSRIAGSRMTYDIETGAGVVENALGRVEPDFLFSAERAEKRGEDRVVLEDATVTTCTQPVPYWSFTVSRARIRLDHYAHLSNLRLRAGRATVFYLPYLVWPVKRDRAAGLLFPSFGSTDDRGQVISEALFLPLGRSADVTVVGEYYTLAGWGGGVDVRAIPSRSGTAHLNAFYIDDQVYGDDRYRITYGQTQQFRNGFRLVADINDVSDFAYFTDYERELRLASSPTILARLEMTRNGSWTSLNVRELRREQLFSDGTSLIQQTLPEIEWRGRSKRLGRTPLYLSFQSSLASIQQKAATIDADYARADLFPVLSVPFSPTPWVDLNATASWRTTWWQQGYNQVTGKVVDESVWRDQFGAGLEIVGPKMFRIFERRGEHGVARYKSTVEPVIAYEYQQEDAQAVPVYDEVDRTSDARNRLVYGLRTRLFARRPRAAPRVAGEVPIPMMGEPFAEERVPDDTAVPVRRGEPAKPEITEPVEILSLEVRQTRALDRFLNTEDANRNGILDPGEDLNENGEMDRSRFGELQAIGRYNPRPATSVDLRATVDTLFQTLEDLSLSGAVSGRSFRTAFSLARSAPVGGDVRTQLRAAAGVNVWGGKIRLDVDGSYDVREGRFPIQRYRAEFYTQCCGFLTEYLERDFTSNTRREFRFTVDLRGIGKFLDLHQGFGE